MRRFREVVESTLAPEDKNVLWLDISKRDEPKLKFYYYGAWTELAGGSSPTPTPTTLVHTFYYGQKDSRIIVDEDILQNVLSLSSSNNMSVSGNFNRIYYYIAIASDQSIVSVITANQENLTSQFVNRGTFLIDNVTYRLYEFFLDTLIPLDITATIRINGETE